MAIMKKHDSKAGEDFYIRIKEDHCLGHNEDKEWTIGEWRADQESDLYDEMNKDWMEVVLKTKTLGIVELGQKSLDLFFMFSSNLDMVRDFIFNSNFLNAYEIGPEIVAKIKEDELELLKFSLKWLRFTMYGEGDFKVNEETRQLAKARQAAKAKEKIELKKQAEEEALAKTPEEIMKEADKGE
jgi:hypothetical protein